MSQRLAVLEMKELNERQRAMHAQMMYEDQRDLLRRVEERNLELERKFEEVRLLELIAFWIVVSAVPGYQTESRFAKD